MIESHWGKPSGELHWRKNKEETTPADGETEGNGRLDALRAAGEAGRKAAMEKFDAQASERAAIAEKGVLAANERLQQTIEDAKKTHPHIFKEE